MRSIMIYIIVSSIACFALAQQSIQDQANELLPICLFGGYCKSSSDCVSGTTCHKHSEGYSQCLIDFNYEETESVHNECAAPYESCKTMTSACCNKAFSCVPDSKICIPLSPPDCRNPITFDPVSAKVLDTFVVEATNPELTAVLPINPWALNYNMNLKAVTVPSKVATGSPIKTNSNLNTQSGKPTFKSTTKPTAKPTSKPTSKPNPIPNPTTKPTPSRKPVSNPIKYPSYTIPLNLPQGSGFLTSKGNQIIDSNGNTVRLTGINWCGYDSPMYTLIGLNMRSYKAIVNEMKGLGFNSFRMPFSLQMLQINNDSFGIKYINYYLNPDLVKLTPIQTLDKILDYCRVVNMRVILDRHSVLPNNYKYEKFWYIPGVYSEEMVIADLKAVAKRYLNNAAMIGIDLWNEPKTLTVFADWSAAATRIGNGILSVNPHLLILVEGTGYMYWWGGCLKFVAEYPVKLINPNQIVYSPHDYGPTVFNQTWFYVKNYPKNLPELMHNNWGFIWRSTSDPRPLIIGEFGASFKPKIAKREKQWMNTLMKYMNGDFNLDGNIQLPKGSQGISWMFWNVAPIGDTGGIYEADFVKINKLKLSFINSSFSKTPLVNTNVGRTATTTTFHLLQEFDVTAV